MKISELTANDVLRFLRLDGTEGDVSPFVLLEAAKSYIRGVTGLPEAEMDEHGDLTVAALVLCADMYENRLTTVEAGHKNMAVDTILGLHRVNLV
ncbi:MAG: head-tail connector protein [Oscillospiraceae bacterium]|nr:head-tail connector protein [Oscillospiraceae bacterium]